MRSVGVLVLLATAAVTDAAWAGGAWVPRPGDGSLQLGASRKRAQSSWGRKGQILSNQQASRTMTSVTATSAARPGSGAPWQRRGR
jgi:hypothetical protein